MLVQTCTLVVQQLTGSCLQGGGQQAQPATSLQSNDRAADHSGAVPPSPAPAAHRGLSCSGGLCPGSSRGAAKVPRMPHQQTLTALEAAGRHRVPECQQEQSRRTVSRNLQGHLLPGRPFAALFPPELAADKLRQQDDQDQAAPMDSDCMDDAFAGLVDGPPIDAGILGAWEGEGSSPQPPGNPLQPSATHAPCWASPRGHDTAYSSPG